MGKISVDLSGKVTLVTGGSRGIGRSIAEALAHSGAKVAVASRTLEDVERVAAQIKQACGEAVGVAVDLADVPSIKAAIEQVEEQLGAIDILVNSAGINIQAYAVDVTEKDWDTVVGINLKGAFFVCQEVGRRMISRSGGKIINIASQMGFVGYFRRSAYCASKGGLVQLTKVLAVEWAEHNINVNAVAPTFIETEFTEGMFAEKGFRKEIIERIPLKKIGKPEDVVGAVLYLSSESANLVTGHTLLVDGGWTAW